MNFSFCILKSVCKMSLMETHFIWVSPGCQSRSWAKEGFGVEQGDLAKPCPRDRSQTSYSRASPGQSSWQHM